ncbi:ABC transporter substrate-binding protein [Cryobacterium aureum]|uniref:ABC transporter substrate-binding protein n=1 Tax=Cryobacterium aureum TaxID=995037 RepID=UPI00101AE60E|nr:sugar ABC transporter substrate-binding protein [Cryobacterium aureum]
MRRFTVRIDSKPIAIDRTEKRMHRRKFTRGGLVATAVILTVSIFTGCAATGDASGEEVATGSFDWKRFDGEEIRFVAGLQPWQAAVEPLIPQFEQKTGIKVNMESLPEDQFRQRLQVELTAGSDDIDVFMSSVQQDGARFAQSGWYEDLKPYIENKSLTAPDYDFGDFSESVVNGHTFDGVLSALPIQLEVQMLYYRKDLLAKAGFDAPPATLDELREMAAAMTDPADGVYGWAARGKSAAAVTQLTSFLLNYGATYMTEDGKAAFDSKKGIAAIEEYGSLIRDYGPSGNTNNSWEELLALFQAGSLALWADNSGQAVAVRDAASSKYADQVGFAPMPAGPAGDAQTFFGWAAGISSSSAQKDASWLFLQWLTSPDVVGQLQDQGIAGGRQSVPFGTDVNPEFVTAFQSALSKAQPQLPQVKSVPEVRDAIGAAIVTSIQGGDAAAATKKAAEAFDQIVSTE